jgi:stage II sporulation protein D
MSQYGAYGAAKRGLSWQKILSFYYPGTVLSSQSSKAVIKVWVTADPNAYLRVMPAAGLRVSDVSGHSLALPAGARYTAWRLTRAGSGTQLWYRASPGHWVKQKTTLSKTTWSFSNTAKLVKVWLPGGVRRELRGTVAFVKRGAGGRTVNRVSMEDYLKSVVPAEMPTSWLPNAVRTQAVAARSYAARMQVSGHSGYDICDTTSCQVYKGYASTSHGRRTLFETKRGTAAVKATAHKILTYRGTIAFTQFGSSNGGHTAKGGYRYLKAKADPYDGVVRSQSWSANVSKASIARAWPNVGTVKKLQVTKRDGQGRWGGRVRAVKIIGSKRTLTVTGTTLQYRFGLRSNLFIIR